MFSVEKYKVLTQMQQGSPHELALRLLNPGLTINRHGIQVLKKLEMIHQQSKTCASDFCISPHMVKLWSPQIQ